MKRTPGGSVFLSCLLLTNLFGARPGLDPADSPQTAPMLNIVIVEGEGTLNNVKQRVNRDPIVQVEDENHKPVAGAAVQREHHRRRRLARQIFRHVNPKPAARSGVVLEMIDPGVRLAPARRLQPRRQP